VPGYSVLIADVTLYSAALGVAMSQACYATTCNHERAMLRQLLRQLDLEGVLIQRMDSIPSDRFSEAPGEGDRLLADGQVQPEDTNRQISSQFQGKRKIPFVATDHEVGHGHDGTWLLRARQAPEHISEAWIGPSWILDVMASGTRDGRPFQATHLFLTSLRTTPETLLKLVRDRWSIERRHWIRENQLHEDAHY
jgi:hypothetical protein